MRWLIAITLCACGSKDTSKPPPPAPGSAEVRPPTTLGGDQLPQPRVDLPKRESFKLLDPGTGERAVLRYSVGDAEVTTHITMTLNQRKLNGTTWSDPSKLPPLRTGFAVAANGSGTVRARALPSEIVGTPTEEANNYLAQWKQSEGRRLTFGFDARGQLGKVAFADDPTSAHSSAAVDDLTQRLLTVVVPVPDAPVGVGASWRAVIVMAQQPVVVKQTATYTLLARSDAGWKVGVELQRIGEEQTISRDTELIALVRKYKGTLEVAPGHALPTGKLDVDSQMHLRMGPTDAPTNEYILADYGAVELATD